MKINGRIRTADNRDAVVLDFRGSQDGLEQLKDGIENINDPSQEDFFTGFSYVTDDLFHNYIRFRMERPRG